MRKFGRDTLFLFWYCVVFFVVEVPLVYFALEGANLSSDLVIGVFVGWVPLSNLRVGAGILSLLDLFVILVLAMMAERSTRTSQYRLLRTEEKQEKYFMKQLEKARRTLEAPEPIEEFVYHPPRGWEGIGLSAQISYVVSALALFVAVCMACKAFSEPEFTSPVPDAWGMAVAWVICMFTFALGSKISRGPLSGRSVVELKERWRRIGEMGRHYDAAYLVSVPGRERPDQLDGYAVLGAAVVGDLGCCIGPWATLPEGELRKHGVVVGLPGSGKTTTLLRIAYLAFKCYGYKVYFLDAKGDRENARRFLDIMLYAGAKVERLRVFPGESFDGFRGPATAILNRLMAIVSYSEPYYRDVAKLLLTLACKALGGPPRGSGELLKRLKLDVLTELYKGCDEAGEIAEISKRDAMGARGRYRAFFEALDGKLDGKWSWEDADAAYFLLDGLALKEEATSLGRYLIEDFAHFASKRKPRHEKVLLIIDDFSAISTGTDVANLFERLREFNAAILVSSQSYERLGTEQDAKAILGAANFVILHQSADPERLTSRAGMRKKLLETYQFGEDSEDRGSVRLSEEPSLHPDCIRRLDAGDAVLISSGRYIHLVVAKAPFEYKQVYGGEAGLVLSHKIQDLIDGKDQEEEVEVRQIQGSREVQGSEKVQESQQRQESSTSDQVVLPPAPQQSQKGGQSVVAPSANSDKQAKSKRQGSKVASSASGEKMTTTKQAEAMQLSPVSEQKGKRCEDEGVDFFS